MFFDGNRQHCVKAEKYNEILMEFGFLKLDLRMLLLLLRETREQTGALESKTQNVLSRIEATYINTQETSSELPRAKGRLAPFDQSYLSHSIESLRVQQYDSVRHIPVREIQPSKPHWSL